MKKVQIWKRTILERRQKGYWKSVDEIIAFDGKKTVWGFESWLKEVNEHKRFKIKFKLELETRSKKDLINFAENYKGRSDSDKQMREAIEAVAREEGFTI